jgi:serine/threonine-protein kinase
VQDDLRAGARVLTSKLVPIEGESRWLDRFELVAELATGGMATVYLGRISGAGGFQRFVGIKRLHPHLAREPEFIQMFLDEARLAARIHHPHVVPILEIGTSEQGYYIVMEYVEGDTLANLIARTVQAGRRMPVDVATRIMVDVLGGLHAAHELADDDGRPLGIVHRDVSPQNILIGIDGSARLTDFGVARATSKLSTTRTGQLKGKLAYMAPEQAHGAKDIDRRADVFAAGVVLWEALEGRRLFRGDGGEADTLNRVLNEPIPPLKGPEPDVPHELESVLDVALARERVARYETAAAFADALERVGRESGDVATHKDVAAYLDDILGFDIQRQRETVRSIIARAEPGRPKSLSMPPPATVSTFPTSPKPGMRRISPEPSGGTSVSSAVISNHAVSRGSPSTPPEASAPARRGRVWPWVLAAGVVIAAGVTWMRWTSGDTAARSERPLDRSIEEVPTKAQAASEAPAPAEPSAQAAPSAQPSASAVAQGAEGGFSTAATVFSAPVKLRPVPRPVVSSPPPAPSLPPDDISRNPYR